MSAARCGPAAVSAALVLLLLLLLGPQPVRAGPTEPGLRALEAAVDKLARESGIGSNDPGVAVLAVRPGRVLLMKGYGLADLRSRAPITRSTRFEIASVSKTMTATAVLMLQERGLLSVHDDVRKYLPELPQYQSESLRLSDMLHHISGLPSYFELKHPPRRNKTYWVSADLLGEFARQQKEFPQRFPIGQKYDYNNSNYMLMSLVIERVAKKPFADFMREEVFLPAGMADTFVYDNPGKVPPGDACQCNNALGYRYKNGNWVESWGTVPARREQHLEAGDGAIWSNLVDMAAWDAAVRGHKLLKPETMKLALRPSRTRDGKTNPYGLGWQLYMDKQLYGFGHEGDWSGFLTSYYNYLANTHTVVLLSNRGHRFDQNKFWKKLDSLIETHAPEPQ